MSTVPTATVADAEELTQEWYRDARYDAFTHRLATSIADPSGTRLARLSELSLTIDRGSCIVEKKKVTDAAVQWFRAVTDKTNDQTRNDAASVLLDSLFALSLGNAYEGRDSKPGRVPFLDRAHRLAAVMNADRALKACLTALKGDSEAAMAASTE